MSRDQRQAHSVNRSLSASRLLQAIDSSVREIFGAAVDILGAETGGGESLADFIVQGNLADQLTISSVSFVDVRRVEGPVRLFFPCAQARLDALPKRLSNQQGDLSFCTRFIDKTGGSLQEFSSKRWSSTKRFLRKVLLKNLKNISKHKWYIDVTKI